MSSTIDPAIESALSNVSPVHRDAAEKLWSEVAQTLRAIELKGETLAAATPSLPNTRINIVQLGAACRDLREFLFERALPIVKETTPANRYPVEFVLPSHLQQLVGYLGGPSSQADVQNKWTWYKREAASFLEQWLADTSLQTYDPFRVIENPLFVEPVDKSSSANAADKSWSKRLRQMRDELVDSLRVAPAVSVAEEAASRAESAAEAAETQAGGAATNTLAAHFEKLATDEKKSAQWWSGTAIASLIVSAGVALVVLWFGAERDHEWVEQLLHLALTLPFVALAAYASAVASRHRHQAWWAGTTAAQLHTVSAYVLPLVANDRSMVLSQLGVRVFGQAAFNTSAVRPETASVLAPVQSLLSRSSDKDPTG